MGRKRKMEEADGNRKQKDTGCSRTKRKGFSWRIPGFHGVEGWKVGETPLPKPLHQKSQEICIVTAIKSHLEAQMAIKFRGKVQAFPKISLDYLLVGFNSLTEEEQTMQGMLGWILENGFIDENDFDHQNQKKKKEGAFTYRIKWERGCDPMYEDFIQNVKDAMYDCTAIGELKFYKDRRGVVPTDTDGRKIYRGNKGKEVPVEIAVIQDEQVEHISRNLGHAVVFTGWGTNKGIDFFEYLDSQGPGYGYEGFAKVEQSPIVIHYVYCPEVVPWF